MKKFKFRLQVVLDIRENELEQRRMESAKILAMLRTQEAELQEIIESQNQNSENLQMLYTLDTLDVQQIEAHKAFGLKLIVDAKNKERIIANTKMLYEKKQIEVKAAHQKVEVLKKLREKQEEKYYKDFLETEIKEIDDITSARYKIG